MPKSSRKHCSTHQQKLIRHLRCVGGWDWNLRSFRIRLRISSSICFSKRDIYSIPNFEKNCWDGTTAQLILVHSSYVRPKSFEAPLIQDGQLWNLEIGPVNIFQGSAKLNHHLPTSSAAPTDWWLKPKVEATSSPRNPLRKGIMSHLLKAEAPTSQPCLRLPGGIGSIPNREMMWIFSKCRNIPLSSRLLHVFIYTWQCYQLDSTSQNSKNNNNNNNNNIEPTRI